MSLKQGRVEVGDCSMFMIVEWSGSNNGERDTSGGSSSLETRFCIRGPKPFE